MSAFSTSRSRLTAPAPAWVLTVALLAIAQPAVALDPDRLVSQYLVDHWGAERGYPGGAVHAITQSSDGHLWIAAEKGLVRFDGLTFTLFVPPPGPAGTGAGVLGVAADPDGGIWARLRGPMLLRLRDRAFGRLEFLGDDYTVVTTLVRSGEGMLLTPLGRGVLRHAQGQVTTRVAQAQMPNSFVIAIAEAADGILWLGTRDAGLLRASPDGVRSIVDGLPDKKVNALVVGAEGDLWIGTDRGVARWTGGSLAVPSLPRMVQNAPALALTRDRDGNVWVALGARGLVRITERGDASALGWETRRQGDVNALFEDREGNLWVGTSRGLGRVRDGLFRTFTTMQGLPSDNVGPVFIDDAQRVWMGPPDGGLYWLANGAVHRVRGAGLEADVVYSITGRDGDVWVGRQRGGLTRIRLDRGVATVSPVTSARGLAQDSVFTVQQARDGSVWAGTLSAGVSHYRDGVVRTYRVEDGLASNTVSAILEAADGSLWFGTPSGVSVRSTSGWLQVGTREGLPSSDVAALFQDGTGTIWIATAAGLAYVESGVVRQVAPTPLLATGIVGLAQDRSGHLWIATAEHLVRVARERLRSPTLRDEDLRQFGMLDGLPSAEGVKRHRSLVADARGSIWFSSARGLSQAEATRSVEPAVPVSALVDGIVADDVPLALAGTVNVPARTRRITVALTASSLATPERVRFRYRLDGFDSAWDAPTAARHAAYTNLPPGTYDFRVMASQGGQIWAGGEARLRLRVAPAYWQTHWFYSGVAVVLSLATWGVYRRRLGQVARQIGRVFEERLAERTRVAQDLHDTLLQGCLSAKMQLHVAVDRMPEDSPTRPAVDRVLQLLTGVIDEGRAAVRGLRTVSAATEALDQAFARTARELAPDHPAGFRVVVEGEPRPLHPIMRDEVYRIGREAIANALRHAQARHIEVELDYTAAHLRLSVRDDGRGIGAVVLDHGRDGHWGLEGMRERARAIGATFRVMTRADAGTEVELVVPGRVAFAQHSRSVRRPWWRARGRERVGPPDQTGEPGTEHEIAHE